MTHTPKYECKLAQAAGLPIDRFPETIEEVSKAEALLARELEKLSIEEHEKIVFEVHGVVPLHDDDDEENSMVEEKLEELEQALKHVEQKEAYKLAEQLNPFYVRSRQFRIMFLRCTEFDACAAADMIVLHFEEKRQLFGDGEVLAREVRQSDLSEEGRIILESGFIQVLNTRDAAGRKIVVLSSAGVRDFPKDGWDEKNEFRAAWYVVMSMLRDEETQKSGSVWILINTDGYKVSMENFGHLYQMEVALPDRFMSGHYCYTDPALKPYVTGVQMFVTDHDRPRLRTHFGTPEEIEFSLMTFGIPIHDCPIKIDGSFSNVEHQKWISQLRACETKEVGLPSLVNSHETACFIPRRFDVLFGKSSLAREHTGTLRALHIVQMHFATYEKLGKYQKTEVADTIISIIHESGGRFLKQTDSGHWIEASDLEARRKISHWFRHARTKKSKDHHGGVLLKPHDT